MDIRTSTTTRLLVARNVASTATPSPGGPRQRSTRTQTYHSPCSKMLITLLTTHSPRDGAWLQKQVVDAVTQGAASAKTALIISDDEVGGWGDHVTPHHSPSETPGEWLQDPYGVVGYTHSGPGFRLLFYIVSPWIRGGPCLHRIVTTILKSSSSRSGSQPRGRMSILLKWFPGEEHCHI